MRFFPGDRRSYDWDMKTTTTKEKVSAASGESDERFRDALELSREWYWEQDENFRLTTVTGGEDEDARLALTEILRKALWDGSEVRAEQDASGDAYRAALAARQPFRDFVYSQVDGNGEVHYIQISGKPIAGVNGAFRGYRGIARDVTKTVLEERLLSLEHSVTRCIAEAESFSAAIKSVIRTICESEGWECGDFWWLDKEAGERRLLHSWGVDSPDIQQFLEQSRGIVLPAAEGNVGEVLKSGRPFWNADMTSSAASARAKIAREAGLRALFIMPITAAGISLAAISFNSRRIREPDQRFLSAVRVIGNQVGQILQRRLAEERVQYLAHHDGLTGLPNRAMFGDLLTAAVQHGLRYHSRFAVMFIDLDRFKIINDTLGHEAGDLLLKEMSGRLRQTLRASDVVARLGGDEFVVLVREVEEPPQMEIVARKLLAALIKPMTILGQECRVTGSIGICMFPVDAEDEESLMKKADMAMYQAKEEGKNDVRFYSDKANLHSLERLALETSLRRALDRKEFVLHYQAKVDLNTNAVTGMEALLRWMHPELGIVAPAQFMPLAEETGLMVPIGRWVIKAACEQSVAWQRQGLPPLCMAVNLSARQFTDEDLIRDLKRALEESGLKPELLELELTEGMVMQNIEQSTKVLAAIKGMGVRLAIDDFGVGYSSLATLKRFPFDTLKVDRSFIRDLTTDGDGRAITEAIVAMGKTLSMTVVAAGVETKEQQTSLQDLACDEMQGFYFNKPIAEAEFAEFLRKHLASSGK
jgi:diguanylate cyclase (GGDEF)-like protein